MWHENKRPRMIAFQESVAKSMHAAADLLALWQLLGRFQTALHLQDIPTLNDLGRSLATNSEPSEEPKAFDTVMVSRPPPPPPGKRLILGVQMLIVRLGQHSLSTHRTDVLQTTVSSVAPRTDEFVLVMRLSLQAVTLVQIRRFLQNRQVTAPYAKNRLYGLKLIKQGIHFTFRHMRCEDGRFLLQACGCMQ